MYVEWHTKRRVYKNSKTYNVYHCCLCFIFEFFYFAQKKCSCLYYISVSYISKRKVVFIGYCQSVKRIGRAVEFSRIHSLYAERNYFVVGRDALSTAYTSQHSNKVQLQYSHIYLLQQQIIFTTVDN